MSELLPCPFCGETPINTNVAPPERTDNEYTECYAFCGGCDARGPVILHHRGDEKGKSVLDAIEGWNRRAAAIRGERE